MQAGGVVQVGPVAEPGRQLAGCPTGQEMLHDGHGPTTGAVHEEPVLARFSARARRPPQEATKVTIVSSRMILAKVRAVGLSNM